MMHPDYIVNILQSILSLNMFSNIEFPPVMFVTGIGTDVGKSFATGWLAKEMINSGINTITQKFIQTGNDDYSEDIERHRIIMNMPMQDVDIDHTTAPEIFSYPASPHLAAQIDRRDINFEAIKQATEKLKSKYDCVLIEGAGGVMVPLTDDMLTIKYIADNRLPAILVTTGQLGSINHALLSLYAMKNANIDIFAVIYNPYFDKDKTICKDTIEYLKNKLSKDFPSTHFIMMPEKAL